MGLGGAEASASEPKRRVLVAIPPGFSLRQFEVMNDVVAYGASKGVEVKMEIVR